MKTSWICLLLLLTASFLIGPGCGGRGDEKETDLKPVLFQESFQIQPDPGQLYQDAVFYFGWKDHDGDMAHPVILCRLVNDAQQSVFLDAEQITVSGETAGSLSFSVRILDGYQGEYFIVIQDEAGNLSNEITRYLYVNTDPPFDQEGEDEQND